jgi:hypothetical protein
MTSAPANGRKRSGCRSAIEAIASFGTRGLVQVRQDRLVVPSESGERAHGFEARLSLEEHPQVAEHRLGKVIGDVCRDLA